ncbi:MauE/DoxX family redox-associated membrane protein [Pedobacter frigidisoli]|uniref:MauE/DoxX family redox-associated membrane protein n=1 Tax=Pedobacter frigidisoli TaxID=2530455 RepID=UPI00292F64C2|nr:MauE/DoxX family redox-associated membrane protein [Pedobacter frigidisoli]
MNILSGLLIVLWVYAAGSKLMVVHTFEHQLSLQHLPEGLVPVLTWALPIIELMAAGLLIVPATIKVGFFLSAVLLVGFSSYITLVLAGFFKDTPCSCGGILSQLGWTEHLIFNFIFLIFSLLGFSLWRKEVSGE